MTFESRATPQLGKSGSNAHEPMPQTTGVRPASNTICRPSAPPPPPPLVNNREHPTPPPRQQSRAPPPRPPSTIASTPPRPRQQSRAPLPVNNCEHPPLVNNREHHPPSTIASSPPPPHQQSRAHHPPPLAISNDSFL